MMSDATEAAPTLVIGHGRDPSSDFALAAAIDLTRRLRGRLHIVHVVGLSDYPIDPDAADWQEQNAVMLAEHRRRVEARLADSGVPWSYEDRHGDPAAELADAATEQRALLIVLGTRGEGMRLALSRLTEPSVTHGVIQHQHRPVLVVPSPG